RTDPLAARGALAHASGAVWDDDLRVRRRAARGRGDPWLARSKRSARDQTSRVAGTKECGADMTRAGPVDEVDREDARLARRDAGEAPQDRPRRGPRDCGGCMSADSYRRQIAD